MITSRYLISISKERLSTLMKSHSGPSHKIHVTAMEEFDPNCSIHGGDSEYSYVGIMLLDEDRVEALRAKYPDYTFERIMSGR